MIGDDGAGASGEGLAKEGLRAAGKVGLGRAGLRRAGLGGAALGGAALGGAGSGEESSGGEGLGGAVSDARFQLQDLRMMFVVSETAGELLVVDLAGSLPARRVSRLMAVSLLKMRILLTWRFLSSLSTWRLTNKSPSISGSSRNRFARTMRANQRRFSMRVSTTGPTTASAWVRRRAISCRMGDFARKCEALKRAVLREQRG